MHTKVIVPPQKCLDAVSSVSQLLLIPFSELLIDLFVYLNHPLMD